MRYLITLLVCLCCSTAWAFPPGFIGAVTSGAVVAGGGISDNFSSDTSSNYTAITGSISISSGKLHGGTWTRSWAYHETAAGSNDHYVQGKIIKSGVDESGLVLRCNGTTGYYVYFPILNQLEMSSFNGGTASFVGAFDIGQTLSADTEYTLKITVSGSTFHAYIDINGDADFGDTNEDLSTLTSSTYSTGQYIGVMTARDSGSIDVTIDDLAGGTL